jgi:pilus assembly protein CpaB
MPNRLKIAVVAAIFFGAIAAYGVYSFLRREQEARDRLKTATVNVVVAAKDLAPGATITPEMLRVVPWPKASVPPGAFSSVEQVKGKVSRGRFVAGEPILQSRLGGEGAGLTVLLTPGHRAMAVRVDEIVGVSGFISPNDRVDVIATVVPTGGGQDKISKIALQNKRVLSVAQNVEQRDGKPQVVRSITLELTPEEAEKLSVAQLQGELLLALRPAGDDKIVMTRGSTKRDLLAISAPVRSGSRTTPVPAAPPPPKKYVVEVYMGGEKSVKEF